MHDIKYIRNNFSEFKKQVNNRNTEVNLDKILELDTKNRSLIQEKEKLESEKKNLSKQNDKSLFAKSKDLSKKIDKQKVPEHVAIIMDGNGRWATKKGLPRTYGHKRGVDVLKEIIKASNFAASISRLSFCGPITIAVFPNLLHKFIKSLFITTDGIFPGAI